ncbi:hypothetical protein TH63_04300 [Rufibacter radiotolerans]|uniref:Uncharacterized protein n=1 Tax=Rufibacter radiotolerans TaxID=1379910 RepID=A0A0H4W3L2_9BACT|nr:hypothetical protein TH63_04300 [Rufibacter radiotolerans]
MYQILIFILVSVIPISQRKEKLSGEYVIKYDHQYYLDDNSIIFSDSTYSKKLKNGGIVKGTIRYSHSTIYLQDNFSTQRIEISLADILKDTLSFSTVETDPRKHSPPNASYLHISKIFGKIIKVK